MESYETSLLVFTTEETLVERLKEKLSEKKVKINNISSFGNINLTSYNYILIDLIKDINKLSLVKNILKGINSKIIVLLPLNIKTEEKKEMETLIQDLQSTNTNLGVILVPEVLGEGINYNSVFLSHELIMQSILSERIKAPSSTKLVNTISVNKLADIIIKNMFSFGVVGQRLALIGPKRGVKTILTEYLKLKDDNLIFYNTSDYRDEISRSATQKVKFSVRQAISSTKATFVNKIQTINSPAKPVVKITQSHIPRVKINYKFLLKLLITLLILVSLPVVFFLISLVFLYSAIKFLPHNLQISKILTSSSQYLVKTANATNFLTPSLDDYINLVDKSNSIFIEGLQTLSYGAEFMSNVLNDRPFALSSSSDTLSASFDKIYNDLNFIQSDLSNLDGYIGRYLRSELTEKNTRINDSKLKLYSLKNLVSRISVLLGSDKPKKYLILFQNNMELRPTGGFIGSFALMTFNKGTLSEIVVNDVYSADGQLKGHVEPPNPIREYLGEGGWYLRDSNWDPDFPASAMKAEWFLEKEIDTTVDGVISIDLSFIKKLLQVTGPMGLPDFDKVITSENLYEIVQAEVEDNFFPGSIKKASFMTSLTKALIEKVQKLEKDKYFNLIGEIYHSLEERHIQIYLHDENAFTAIDKMDYSGSVDLDTECGLRCIKDKYLLVDANLGVNKANLYVTRNHELDLFVFKNKISHKLTVEYKNAADKNSGNSGKYKSYTRILLPLVAEIENIKLYDPESDLYTDLSYDEVVTDTRKEYGFLINLEAMETKRLEITWDINLSTLASGGEYNLLVQKQSGTDNDGLVVNIEKSDLSLTRNQLTVYTSDLVKDFKLKLFFKP